MKRLLILFVGICFCCPAAAQKIPVSIAAFSTPQIASDAMYRRWGEALKAAPGAPFDVKLLVRGELGADENVFNALRRERVQLVGVGYASVSTAIPEFTVLNAPFLFESWEEVDYVYDNHLLPLLNDLLAQHGMMGLRHYGQVWHGIYGRKAITEPAQMKNMRFRALIDAASQFIARDLGADMIQIPLTDIVTGLQTGLIDAGETNDLIYLMTGTNRDAPDYTFTRHTTSILTILANTKWWNTLSPTQQKTIDAGYASSSEARTAMRANAATAMAEAMAAGNVRGHELTPEARARWQAATSPVHQRLIAQAGGRAQELYDRVQDGKRAYRQRKGTPP
jgi:TRAP-type C4-dicarboxylate transport system substrate-binding protein